MLHNTFVQLLILFLTLLEPFLVVEDHFLLLPQDLLDDLMLVLSELVHGVVRLQSELLVLLPHALQAPEVLVRQRVRLLLPSVANLDQLRLFLAMDHSELVAAAGAVRRIAGKLALQLADRLRLLLLLSLKLGNLALEFKVGLALAIWRLLEAVIVVLADQLLGFEIHVADVLDLGQAEVKAGLLGCRDLLGA